MPDKIKDRGASLWISASAGTGKTKSLVERILALLLNGVKPSKILCLTYTNAAAAEMLARLANFCRQWKQMSRDDLVRELKSVGFDESHAESARSLHEKSLNSEWVYIQTIHSFCLGMLKRFPLETGLLPGVKLCDNYQRKQMLDEAIGSVLLQEKHQAHWETIADHTMDVRDLLADNNITKIQHFTAKIQDFATLYGDFFNLDHGYNSLTNEALNEKLFWEIFDGHHRAIFAELAETLALGAPTDIKKAEILRTNSTNPSEKFVEAFLLKNTNKIYDKLCTRAIVGAGFQERMQEIALKAQKFQNMRKKHVAAQANEAFFSVAGEIIRKFTELKSINHCLDFNDVITIATTLLDDMDWVIYKIDGNVDHILIDEAQDTSPEQWEIIRKISDEFFANYQPNRTLCVVGDEKQSIYSFQGADIKLFSKMHAYFKTRSTVCGQKFYDVSLNESYRTTGRILSFVDDIFAETFPSLKHISRRDANSGVVEVVDLFENDQREEIAFWETDNSTKLSAGRKLSIYVAEFIKNAIDGHILVESKQRAARASDFLILFQRRDVETMENITAALKDVGIRATGIDKVLLRDQLIVEDLIAFAEFAVFPRDDLMCACCLKSPLVSMTEDDLMRCCLDRKEKKLWNYLQNNEELWRKYSLNKLKDYIDRAFQLSSYDFFMNALMDGAEEKFMRRLGAECLDVLHEFLDVVMRYEKENPPSLPSFLHWFKSFEHEIKRESFSDENSVRLMTVHASKGLQSPFVLIADSHFFQTKGEKFLETEEGVLLWNFGNDARIENIAQLHANNLMDNLGESRRLLYVALTRAEDVVCVLGQKQNTAPSDKCWHNFVQSGMDKNKFMRKNAFGAQLMRFGDYAQIAEKDHPKENEPAESLEIPSWFYEKLPLDTPSNQED
ncbi:MAG: UvrD-helicase domain-containing protein [Holosporaceae bacterium]|jgi:ATP-dependent helicase/nuclease subunit A|nr:UvrD-helicase domain-containing protein [Holosporaceae bacterium]